MSLPKKQKLSFNYTEIREKMAQAEALLLPGEKKGELKTKFLSHLKVFMDHITTTQKWKDVQESISNILDKNQAEGEREGFKGTKVLLEDENGKRFFTQEGREAIKKQIAELKLDEVIIEFYPHWWTDESRMKTFDPYLLKRLAGFLFEEKLVNKVLLDTEK